MILSRASEVFVPVKVIVASPSGLTNVQSEEFRTPVWKSSETIAPDGCALTERSAELLVTVPIALETKQRNVEPLSDCSVAGVV